MLGSEEECENETDRLENDIRQMNNESAYAPSTGSAGMYFLYMCKTDSVY